MKVLSINSVPYGSTCTIMQGVAKETKRIGCEVTVATGFSTHPTNFNVPYILIGNIWDKSIHILLARLLGRIGCFSEAYTRKFLKKVEKFTPDVIHLHNLHGWYINLPLLFRYIKKHHIRVIWTLHDCWAFTGHCPHFTMAKCDKWKTGCHHCPQYKEYPQSAFDDSKAMWKLKKKWFTGVEDMTIVTPSQWLADLVKQSFLKDYPVKVIHNGIDLGVFKPTASDFREKHGIPEDKCILLGVSFGWGVRKGLDVFLELAKRLDSQKYQIVLVGTDETVDKQLPDNIISIHRTGNQQELAQIYTAADLFVNPTREENYPTVNMEALACGTPVITFRTGGSPEIIDETCGCVVNCDDVDTLTRQIQHICENKLYSMESCLKRAAGFGADNRYKEYLELYGKM